ncbi:hypothetical protein PC9H_010971 [Pleurotus ostreatus]|uniref:Major facilitator superfamily (MFS) profile domain-containing protein n=1 Tax=Pleurotus ostreatus TaxID=5322 RepID=A0A8H6ZSM8_PLEOS|nr:uncharacterized protein PC9H_010971 [Pleurotus ostreatus]KAF7422812.1 hypothetical protein PC9H_010971 [Pleurotus ostreatus]KAJ8691239.1 hypothetical protein PTI98_010834 [Pleurotus ostreatus]
MDHVPHLAGLRHHAQVVDQPSDSVEGEASIDDNTVQVQISADGTKSAASPSSTVGTSKDILDVEKGATVSVEHPGYRYIDFEEDDPRNPMNFTRRRKWAITLVASMSTILASSAAGAYNMGVPSMLRDLNCTEFQAAVGLAVYPLGFGVVPLVTASWSEEFGRMPLYVGSAVGFCAMFLGTALAKNIQSVIVMRFLLGAFGSTGATMVGGTIADIWAPHERGLPMALFSAAAVGGTGVGPILAGWIEMNPHLDWRWIQWIQLMYSVAYTLILPFVLTETRSAILINRLASKARKEAKKNGDPDYNRIRAKVDRPRLGQLIWVSCTRPIYLLFTEPIVIAFSLWIGFSWGIIYGVIESMGTVFKTLHNFNQGQIGTAFVSMVIGTLFGFITVQYQEQLYKKYYPKRDMEARLYTACFAAILFPAGIFIYAWCSFTRVHWIGLIIGIVIFGWASFLIYHSVFTYLADCYGPFASSALAAQSLFRNLLGMAFPLFIQPLLTALTFKWANTLLAFAAVLLLPIPYVLYFFGPSIRSRSKFASAVMASQHKAPRN